MKVDNSIIEKIQKLLALANSPNEHEAKAATARANALLLKYNLSMQQVEGHQSTYVADPIADSGLTLKPHIDQITNLLQEFFFVKVIISSEYQGHSSGEFAWKKSPRAQYRKVIKLVGTIENVKIATYIFQYLEPLYPKLWKDKYERNAELKPSDRKAYYMGLTVGIGKLLEETKWKVEEEMGLVVVEDPALKKFTDDITKGKSYGSSSSSDVDPDVFKAGVKDGQNITLRKPIESEQSQNNTVKLIKST